MENETELNKDELNELLRKKLDNLKELEEIGKDSNYIKELSDVALIQLRLTDYPESEKNYIICLKHFKKQKDRLGQAAVYGVLGTLYFKASNYKESINSYQKAYEIYKELNQVQEQITCLKGIGNTYVKMNKLDEAVDVFLDCSAVCSDKNDIYNLLDCLGSLIYIYETIERWDIVFELYKKSLKAFEEIKDFKGIITSYFNLGILQKKNNDLEEALIYFKKGTNVAIDANYAELIIRGLSYAAETLFYLGKIKDAKNQFIRALHIAKNINANNAIVQLRVLLQSLGLSDYQINEELREFGKAQK